MSEDARRQGRVLAAAKPWSSPAPATWPPTPARRRSSSARKVVAMCDSNGWVYDDRRHRPGRDQADQRSGAQAHQRIRVLPPEGRVPRRLRRHLGRALRRGSALRHAERAASGRRGKPLIKNGVYRRGRGREHAHHARRGARRFQSSGRAVRSRARPRTRAAWRLPRWK